MNNKTEENCKKQQQQKKPSIIYLPTVTCINKSRKVGSQEIPGVMFGLEVQNEPGQRLTESCQENPLVIAKTLFQQQKM